MKRGEAKHCLALGVTVMAARLMAAGPVLGPAATASDMPQSPDDPSVISLSGTWRFQMDPQDVGQGERWHDAVLPETVVLPGTMDENGKGIINLRRDFTGHLSRERTYAGRAWYQRDIEIPEAWASKRMTLHLERTRFSSVWIDGFHLGDHDRLGCEQVFDLTGAVEPGRHVLSIRVDNRGRKEIGGGHMLTDHTQVNWNGILGRIALQATDPLWIERALVYPDVANRSVRVKVTVGNITGAPAEGSIVPTGQLHHRGSYRAEPVHAFGCRPRPVVVGSRLWSRRQRAGVGRILETYGNHPSFVMMSLGNEMHRGRPTRADDEATIDYREFFPTE